MVSNWVCNRWMSKTQLSAFREEAAACELQLARGLVVSFTTTWTKPKLCILNSVNKRSWDTNNAEEAACASSSGDQQLGLKRPCFWQLQVLPKKKGLKFQQTQNNGLGRRLWSWMEGKCLKWGLCRERNTSRWPGSFGNPTSGLLISSCVSQGETKPNPFSHTDERLNNFTYCHW